MYGYWFGMNLVWWIFWVCVIVAFFAFLTPVPRRTVRLGPPADPLEILRRRYAAGEITTAEYDERRARIMEIEPGAPAATRPTIPAQRVTARDEHRTSH